LKNVTVTNSSILNILKIVASERFIFNFSGNGKILKIDFRTFDFL
jgi:hypothetical protein